MSDIEKEIAKNREAYNKTRNEYAGQFPSTKDMNQDQFNTYGSFHNNFFNEIRKSADVPDTAQELKQLALKAIDNIPARDIGGSAGKETPESTAERAKYKAAAEVMFGTVTNAQAAAFSNHIREDIEVQGMFGAASGSHDIFTKGKVFKGEAPTAPAAKVQVTTMQDTIEETAGSMKKLMNVDMGDNLKAQDKIQEHRKLQDLKKQFPDLPIESFSQNPVALAVPKGNSQGSFIA